MAKLVVSIDDLSDDEIGRVLRRASEFEKCTGNRGDESTRLVGLLFAETSLRTRVGFLAAAARLGWQGIDVFERRSSPTSMVESWGDTLETLCGYVDVLVVRAGEQLERSMLSERVSIPFLNGGSVGPDAEHPSQALIDLYAIERECGAVGDLKVAICGDLRMRAVRSLLKMFVRHPPRLLVLVTVPDLIGEGSLLRVLPTEVEFREGWDLEDVDVLYVAGIPHRAIPEGQRDLLRVTPHALGGLASHAVIFSPLPVIDEIDDSARTDPRIRMFGQSDRALFVRMALLELLTL